VAAPSVAQAKPSPFPDSSNRILIACLKTYTFHKNFRVNTSIHVGFITFLNFKQDL
jgi:hypothetical protein